MGNFGGADCNLFLTEDFGVFLFFPRCADNTAEIWGNQEKKRKSSLIKKEKVSKKFAKFGPKQTIAENRVPIFEPDFLLDFGPFSPACVVYNKNTLCTETPEFCYGKIWPDK